jgi:DNA-binding GntR family transcriptional regulator
MLLFDDATQAMTSSHDSPARAVRTPAPGGRATTRDGHHVILGHERLRNMILNREVEPGSELSQTDLVELLGIGRTPLREVLRLLDQEGLVQAAPNRPVLISGLSASDAEDIYVVRMSLELIAIRLTVPVLAPAELAQLEGLMTQMEYFTSARDLIGRELTHRDFHLRLTRGAPPRARQQIARLFDHASRYRHLNATTAPGSWEKRRGEHRAVLDAVEAHDVAAAVEGLAHHYVVSFTTVVNALDPDFEPIQLRNTLSALAPEAGELL